MERTEAEKQAYKEKLRSLTFGTAKQVRQGVSWFDTTVAEQQRQIVAEGAANGHSFVPAERGTWT